jgi:hypothetical protein
MHVNYLNTVEDATWSESYGVFARAIDGKCGEIRGMEPFSVLVMTSSPWDPTRLATGHAIEEFINEI